MLNKKLIAVGACTIGLVVVGFFYSCKKNQSSQEERSEK